MRRLLIASLLALPAFAFAQGSLTPPPGAPAASMKSLDQIEPRIPLRDGAPGVTQNANGGFTISASGSYYLEGNLTVSTGDGIVIETSSVSLDLSGYTIASFASPAGGDGIRVNGHYPNIAIHNGHIRGTTTYDESTHSFTDGGFRHGIYSSSLEDQTLRAAEISVVGVSGTGIYLNAKGSIISNCTASLCSGGGLRADTVTASSATTCAFNVIVADTVADCQASGVTVTPGYPAISAKSVANSVGKSISGDGIDATSVTNSLGDSTSGVGIYADRTATGSTGTSVTSTGLRATIATGCNGYSNSGIGLEAAESATGCTGNTRFGRYGLTDGGTANNCRGEITNTTDASSIGLLAGTATNCIGINKAGTGLSAEVATGCKGTSTSGTGLVAKQNATGSTGITATGSTGLLVGDTGAAGTAENCRGIVTGGTGTGLSAEVAANCFGQSTAGTGLAAASATNCSAYTASGAIAMSVAGTADSCRGNNGKTGGTAIQSSIAVSCTSAGGAISASAKYNMP
jgi:hypothetical protein